MKGLKHLNSVKAVRGVAKPDQYKTFYSTMLSWLMLSIWPSVEFKFDTSAVHYSVTWRLYAM